MKIISTVIMIMMLSSTAYAVSGEVEKWSEPPRDIYAHTIGSAVCFYGGVVALKKMNQEYPKIKAALGCFAVGLLKEFAVDSKESYQEIALNTIGISFGWNFDLDFE